MPTYHLPRDVSRDALLDVVAGWDDTAPAMEQTEFLESVGVIAHTGEGYQLTERGRALAGALADGDEARARERARVLLGDWAATEGVRGVVRGNPTDADELARIVAGMTGHDPEDSGVRGGFETLLECYEWAGLLGRDGDGRYRLPEARAASEAVTGTAESAAEARCGVSLAGPAESEDGEPSAAEPDDDADAAGSVRGETERADGGSAPAESGK